MNFVFLVHAQRIHELMEFKVRARWSLNKLCVGTEGLALALDHEGSGPLGELAVYLAGDCDAVTGETRTG